MTEPLYPLALTFEELRVLRRSTKTALQRTQAQLSLIPTRRMLSGTLKRRLLSTARDQRDLLRGIAIKIAAAVLDQAEEAR